MLSFGGAARVRGALGNNTLDFWCEFLPLSEEYGVIRICSLPVIRSHRASHDKFFGHVLGEVVCKFAVL